MRRTVDALFEDLHAINRKLDQIMTTQAQFDTDLAALSTAVNSLLAAYQTAVGGDVDLSAADSTVTGLTASINAALTPAAPAETEPAAATDQAVATGTTPADPGAAADPATDPAVTDPAVPVDPSVDPTAPPA